MKQDKTGKQLTLSLTPEQHKMIKLKAVQRGISIKALVLLAIEKINGGDDGKV